MDQLRGLLPRQDRADSSPSIATDAHRVPAVPVPAYIDLMSVSPKVFLCPHTMARVARCVPVPASKIVLMPVSPEVFLCLQTTARVARCVPVPVYIVLMPVFQRLFLCPSLVIFVVFWTDRNPL